MKLSTLIKHSAELFRIISKSRKPSDKIASQYFRSKKYIGSKERRFISDLIFKVLRIRILPEYCIIKLLNSSLKDTHVLEECYKENQELLTILVSIIVLESFYGKELSIEPLIPKFSNPEQMNSLDLLALESDDFFENCNFPADIPKDVQSIINELDSKSSESIEVLANLYSFPEWILTSLTNIFNHEDLKQLAQSFLYPAPLCLRVNADLLSQDKAIEIFKEDDILSTKSKISPVALLINKRVRLNDHKLYKNALLDVQDQGSQLISFAVSPDKGASVLDACAGAGGKTLHLAQLQKDSGKIVANDVEYRRLKELKKRVRKFQYKSVETHLLKPGNNLESSVREFDYILIDAPCSGMGTARRMPMTKYRLTPELLNKLSHSQYEILSFYSKYLKKGGILVYATCSIMPEENEFVTERFLQENPDFAPASLKEVFEINDIQIDTLSDMDYKITLYPHQFNSDGFFMARIKKG